jgi:orotate phosphoribosyltransferase
VTAGTAMRESLKLVNEQGGKVVAFIVALDRQERVPGAREKADGILDDATDAKTSTLGQIRNEFGIPSTSIINFDDLIAVLKQKGDENDLKRLEAYKAKYQAID